MKRNPAQGGIRYFRRAELPGLEAQSIEQSTHPCSFFTSSFMIVTTIHSHSSFHVGRVRTTAESRCIYVMEPGTLFGVLRLPHPETAKCLFLPPQILRQISEESECDGEELPTIPAALEDRKLFESLRLFHESFERKDSSGLEIESRLFQALRWLLGRTLGRGTSPAVSSPGRESWAVQQARSMIDDRCAEKISLAELAEETGLSRFQILRSFSREVGVPPHAYQLHRRIERAKALLTAGVAIAHVAADLGFYDQSHFTRCFKIALGVTPLQYSQA